MRRLSQTGPGTEAILRGLQAIAGSLAVLASIWLLRIVYHAYTEHAHLDVFHLGIGLGSAAVGLLLVRRAYRDSGSTRRRVHDPGGPLP
jgi:hypothetical protein